MEFYPGFHFKVFSECLPELVPRVPQIVSPGISTGADCGISSGSPSDDVLNTRTSPGVYLAITTGISLELMSGFPSRFLPEFLLGYFLTYVEWISREIIQETSELIRVLSRWDFQKEPRTNSGINSVKTSSIVPGEVLAKHKKCWRNPPKQNERKIHTNFVKKILIRSLPSPGWHELREEASKKFRKEVHKGYRNELKDYSRERNSRTNPWRSFVFTSQNNCKGGI